MSFEAALLVSGTIRLTVEFEGAEVPELELKERVIRLLSESWDPLTLGFARALKEDLTPIVCSLSCVSQLADQPPVMLTRIEKEEKADG